MALQKYPLEALRKLRDERAGEQAQQLAAQVARGQAAERQVEERQRARQAHAQRLAEAVRLERERVMQGGASGADLRRVTEFEAAARLQAEQLERAEAGARQALRAEREHEQELRDALARSEADAKLVRNHEAGFHEQAALRVERAEEEAALEQWNARRR